MQHSYQTVKLGRGKHSSPEHGACVMELASMLAGEPFTDHPRSVSPVIAAFLRNYNDLIDDQRRQDLYAYASKVVGSVTSLDVEAARAERLVAWGDESWEVRARRSILGRLRRRAARDRRWNAPEPAARYAIHAIGRTTAELHASALSLVDELIAMRTAPQAQPDVAADAEAWPQAVAACT